MDNGDSDTQNTSRALNEIRDSILMLSLGNNYLCEDPFLIKIGRSIDTNIEKLKGDISSLKQRFPGKFAKEIDTDELLEELHITAQNLQKPDKEINDKCIVGALGRELEAKVKSLTSVVSAIRAQVEAQNLTYTRRDSLLGLFGRFQNMGGPIGNILNLGLKILICLIVMAIFLFFYLYLTLESTADLMKDVTVSQEYIRAQGKILSKLDLDREQIARKVASIEKKGGQELGRKDKIVIMDLEMEIRKIDDKRNKIALDIGIHEDKILKNQKKIEEINKKPFIKRLLRL